MTMPLRLCCAFLFCGFALSQAPAPAPAPEDEAINPYRLEPFHSDYPVELAYPKRHATEYDRTRRQVIERIVANLQGAGRRETWQCATEFFWRAPEEFAPPLIAAMDRYFGDPSMKDMVRNCIEAMGRMRNSVFDEALRRALEHESQSIRQAALGALAYSSTDATLRELHRVWPQMDGRARKAWLEAARTRLGDEAVSLFRDLMMAEFPARTRDEILRETLKMPVEQAAVVLRGRWNDAVGEFKAIIAGVLHGAGDSAGTTWLLEALRGGDLAVLPIAVRHCRYGPLGELRNPLLSLSGHPRPAIRLELAKLLRRFEGDDIASVYELLSRPEEPWEIRSLALRELTRRGRNDVASALLEEVATAQGTRLRSLLNMLGATGDPRAVPIFVERFRKAPEGEGRPFLQALAVLGCRAAAEALLEIFLEPDRRIDRASASKRMTTMRYIPLVLMNARGSGDLVADAFEKLSREDWRRRALLLPTVLGMAVDIDDEALRDRAEGFLRTILFDREELPQLRVQALNLMTRGHLGLDDVLRMKRRRFDEAAGMRSLWNDFLLDFF